MATKAIFSNESYLGSVAMRNLDNIYKGFELVFYTRVEVAAAAINGRPLKVEDRAVETENSQLRQLTWCPFDGAVKTDGSLRIKKFWQLQSDFSGHNFGQCGNFNQ